MEGEPEEEIPSPQPEIQRSTELVVTDHDEGANSQSYLHNLVGNFNTLYEQKLAEAERNYVESGEGGRESSTVEVSPCPRSI